MEILGSTQYVNLKTQKEPWLQLSVINQWDWRTGAVSFKLLDNTRINYCIKLNTPETEDIYRSETIENITDKMKQELIDKGHTLINDL